MLMSSAKDKNPVTSDMMFYGVIQQIWELDYYNFKAPLFVCAWADNARGVTQDELGFTLVNLNRQGHKKYKFVSTAQVKQVFHVKDPLNTEWSVVLRTPNKDYRDAEYGDDLGETCTEQPPFATSTPLANHEDEDDVTFMRDNVEGFWLDPNDAPREE